MINKNKYTELKKIIKENIESDDISNYEIGFNTLSPNSIQNLVGRRIQRVGNDYIQLDDGMSIYLEENEIDNINSRFENY